MEEMEIMKRGSSLNVKDYGAQGDGQTLETESIQTAIDQCADSGGGTILFPSGEYRTGAIRLRSHVGLHLDTGATIKGSGNLRDYYLDGELVGLVTARKARGITISGYGAINGSGISFIDVAGGREKGWYDPDAAPGTESFTPGHTLDNGPAYMLERPGPMLDFATCEDIVIDGITVVDTPFYAIIINGCDRVRICNLRIQNPPFIPNNDGIHCTTSRNVIITGCDIKCGDDPIAVTGINDEYHCKVLPGFISHTGVTANIIVSDCILHGRSSGVRVGYGHNDIQNCIFQNLIIESSNRGLGIFVRDSGSIRNVRFTNIVMRTVMSNEPWWGNGEPIHVSAIRQCDEEAIGEIESIRFTGIKAVSPNGILIHGIEDSTIRDIAFEDVQVRIVNDPRAARRGGIFDLRPVFDKAIGWVEHDTPSMYCQHVDGLRIRNTKIELDDDLPDFITAGLQCESVHGLDSD